MIRGRSGSPAARPARGRVRRRVRRDGGRSCAASPAVAGRRLGGGAGRRAGRRSARRRGRDRHLARRGSLSRAARARRRSRGWWPSGTRPARVRRSPRGSSSTPRGRRCWRRRRCAGWTSGRSAGRPRSCWPWRSARCVGLLGLASAAVLRSRRAGLCRSARPTCCLWPAMPAWVTTSVAAGLALTAIWTAAFAVLAALRLVALVAGAAAPGRARAGSGGRRRWRCSVSMRSMAWNAASSPTTRRIARCASRRRLALALVAAGVALARLRTRRTRAALAQLVLDIGAAPAPGELRERLADSLGDPSLELLHRLEGGEWIDDRRSRGRASRRRRARGDARARRRRGCPGRRAPARPARRPGARGRAGDHGQPRARARAASTPLAVPGWRSCAPRARASSPRRTHERRALERDLHDGAQQRLVAVALAIRLARHRIAADDPALDAGLAAAEARVRAAVVELRDVAHGLFPTVLADEGLRAALEELSEHAPRFVPRAVPAGRFPGEVESAAYFAARRVAAPGRARA